MTPTIQERFLKALQTGNTTKIEAYLKKYPEAVSISIMDVGSPLHYVIHYTPEHVCVDVIRLLLDYNADPKQTMQESWLDNVSNTTVTPLRIAAAKGLKEVTELIANHPNTLPSEAALFLNRAHFLPAMLEVAKVSKRYSLAPKTWRNYYGEPANISYMIVGPDYSHDSRCTTYIKQRIDPFQFPQQLAYFEKQIQTWGRYVGVNFHRSEWDFAAVTIAFVNGFIDELGNRIVGMGNTELKLNNLWTKGTACVVLTGKSLENIQHPPHQHTLVHELGHVISLKHPMKLAVVDDPHVLPDDEATVFNSVMAYQHELPIHQFSSEVQTFFPGKILALFATTPMPYDITTARLLYGLNETTHAGNTTHSFKDNQSLNLPLKYIINASTILDTDGFNTLDTSSCRGNVYIDTTHTPFGKMIFGCVSLQRLAFETHINAIIAGRGNDLIIADNNVTEITTDVGFDTLELSCLGSRTVVTDLDYALDDLRFNINTPCSIQAMNISNGQITLTVGENAATAMQVLMPAVSQSSFIVAKFQIARTFFPIKILIQAQSLEIGHCLIDQNNYLRCFPDLPKHVSLPAFMVVGICANLYLNDIQQHDHDFPNEKLLMISLSKFALSTQYYPERLAFEFGYKLLNQQNLNGSAWDVVKTVAQTAFDFGIQYTGTSIVNMVQLMIQPCVATKECWQQQRSENHSYARSAIFSFFAGLDSAVESIARMAPGGQHTLDYQERLLAFKQ